MFKLILIILALVSLMAGTPMVLAQHGHVSTGHHSLHDTQASHLAQARHAGHATHGVHNGIHLPADEVLREWGCDEDMLKALHKLQDDLANKSIDLEADLAKAELALERAHDDKDVSQATLHAAIDRYFAAKSDLLKLKATAAVEARETMGEELFNKIHEAHMDRD